MSVPAPLDSAESILVTGGTGFVGSHLVRRLVHEGLSVHLLVRPRNSYWRIEDVISKVTLWHGELTDIASIQRCIAGAKPTTVFHLGASTAGRRWTNDMRVVESSIDVNLKGTLNLMYALHDADLPVKRIIRTGSLLEYGSGPVPYEEGQREFPASPYTASQVATTVFLQALALSGINLPVVNLRLGWVYGPTGPSDYFIASLIMQCLERREFNMTAGVQKRDFVYVSDVVDACIKASAAEAAIGEIINIGGGKVYRLREVGEMIVSKMATTSRLNFGDLNDRIGDAGDAYCNNAKAKKLLGWSPVTSLADGLDQTIAWYAEHGDRMRQLEARMS